MNRGSGNTLNKIFGLLMLFTMAFAGFSCNNSNADNDGRKGMFAGWFGAGLDVEEIDLAMSEELSDSMQMVAAIKELELPKDLHDDFKNFYQERDYQTAWMRKKGVNKEGEALLKKIEEAPADGLNSEDYKLQYLYHLKQKVEKEKETEINQITKLDKELTAAYLKYASHKLRGRVDPSRVDTLWKASPRETDLAAHLESALNDGKIAKSLDQLNPPDPQYAALKKAYNNYRQLLEKNGEWPQLPNELTLKAGDSSKYVTTLRERLAADGFYNSPRPDSIAQVYDSTLVQAVMVYQDKNGLEPDGLIGGETLNMLNTPLKERINQLQLNLERMRWSAERPNDRYLLVNVPQYMLYIYEGGNKVMDMKVIVGEAYATGTPLFNDTLEYISFSPTWTVPNSIATEEMLPILQKNPDYLKNNNFKLYEGWSENAAELDPADIDWKDVSPEEFPYRIVQQPGDMNALGHIKFMFPNELDIYLHDTPNPNLFKKAERDFSHGCIRVERPVDLAHYLLEDAGWDKTKIEEHMNLDEPKDVPVKEKLPVILDYRTAWVDDDGRITFAKDIYGHDRKQMQRFDELLAEN